MFLAIAALLSACSDYQVHAPTGKADSAAEPLREEYPSSPDGDCPPEFPLDNAGWSRRFAWVSEETPSWTMDQTYLGPGEWKGRATYMAEIRDASGAVARIDHYACDRGNVWSVARVAQTGRDICPCDERDCVFQNDEWEPPVLRWSSAGVQSGLPFRRSSTVATPVSVRSDSAISMIALAA